MPPRRALPNIHNWTKHLESRIAPARSSLVNPSCRIDTRLSLRDGAVKAREIVLIINLGAPLLDGRATHRQRAPREARGKDQAKGGLRLATPIRMRARAQQRPSSTPRHCTGLAHRMLLCTPDGTTGRVRSYNTCVGVDSARQRGGGAWAVLPRAWRPARAGSPRPPRALTSLSRRAP